MSSDSHQAVVLKENTHILNVLLCLLRVRTLSETCWLMGKSDGWRRARSSTPLVPGQHTANVWSTQQRSLAVAGHLYGTGDRNWSSIKPPGCTSTNPAQTWWENSGISHLMFYYSYDSHVIHDLMIGVSCDDRAWWVRRMMMMRKKKGRQLCRQMRRPRTTNLDYMVQCSPCPH